MAVVALCTLSAPVWAQTTTYSEDFVSGTAFDPGDPQVDNWETFRDNLTATYSNITVGGSEGPDVSCSDPAAISAIASALNTDATAAVACEGRTWNIGTCAGSNELSIDVGICTCQAGSPFTLRPDVDVGNAAWGGIGATCGPGFSGVGANVDQTLTVSVSELGPPTDIDLSLTLNPAALSPIIGSNTFFDVDLLNIGPADATGVSVDFALPSGFTYVSDDSGGAYNSSTGVWTVGSIIAGSTPSLRVVAAVEASGSFTLEAEVASANENDTDSTPGNVSTAPGEDDSDSVTLTPIFPPPPLFCLGRPINPLVFRDPIAESVGANLTTPQVGDVFRFAGVSAGIDALVQVTAFNNGASLIGIDNDTAAGGGAIGIPDNFQPTLLALGAGDASVDFEITVVASGTSIPGTLDFAGSAIDVDGNGLGNGLREYIEVSDNIVEFALNGVPVPADPTGPTTRLITQANTPPDAGASAPSAADRIRFESDTDEFAPSIDPDEPRNIAAAFFTDVSIFQYRIGKLGAGTGAAGRLNSLAFNCPDITPSDDTINPLDDEDFTDTPISYGNAIHVIDPAILLGPTNTDETGPGDDPTASSDLGDDGVPGLPASFEGLVPVNFNVNVSGPGGLLQGFFDWNGDGDFEDGGEHAIVDLADVDGDGVIPVTVTPQSSTTGTSFARFRWATSSVGVSDPAGDGEVEDYQINLVAAAPTDLSLSISASPPNPFFGDTSTLTIIVRNDGPETVGDIVAFLNLPFSVGFVSSDGGTNFDSTTRIWTIPGTLAPGEIATLQVVVSPVFQGSFDILAEIDSAGRPDTDSTPGNANTTPNEDDTDVVTLTVVPASNGPAVCPAGLVLVTEIGNAVSVELNSGVASPASALGVLTSLPFAGDPATVSAELDTNGDILVLDLGVIVAENAIVTLQLARDGGAAGSTSLIIVGTSLTNTGFTSVLSYGANPDIGDSIPDFLSSGQDILESVTFAVPAGGARFIQFENTDPVGDDTFIDGMQFGQTCINGGELQGTKAASVFDPLGEGLFALPGNDVTYTITVQNDGDGPTDDDSIFLIDELPPEVTFFNGDADGPGPGIDPVNFNELVATGLDPFVFGDSVRFAGAGPPPANFDACGLTPAAGYDQNVRFICFNAKGMMNAGDPNPAFTLSFRARIR